MKKQIVKRKCYGLEFKKAIVNYVKYTKNITIKQIEKDFNLPEGAVRKWRIQLKNRGKS